jgi:hypothetical protein
MTSFTISLNSIIQNPSRIIPNESGLGDILSHLKKLGRISINVDNKCFSYKTNCKVEAYTLFKFIVRLAKNSNHSTRTNIVLINYKRTF